MKTSELRLGNFLHPNSKHLAAYGDNPAFVTAVYEDGFIVCNHYPGEWFEPIPLTEEWLVKFGFYKDKQGDYSKILQTIDQHLCIIESASWFYPTIISEPEFSNGATQVIGLNRIQYVHQLQNLYFCLTGDELNIIK